jgi:hypothetical protein
VLIAGKLEGMNFAWLTKIIFSYLSEFFLMLIKYKEISREDYDEVKLM